MHLDFIYNPEFAGGNAVSVRAAREFVGYDSFMLAMGDHVIEPSIALRLSAAMGQSSILGVDSAAAADGQLSDATKVLLDDAGYLLRIGKELRHWNAVDIGVFRFEPSVFDTLDQLYDTYGASLELHQLMRCLANQAPGVATCDIEGKFWSDIDTIDDYESADQHIGVSPALSV
jgi:CDP-L-myo-inositol myo-inositolphosphotransferase